MPCCAPRSYRRSTRASTALRRLILRLLAERAYLVRHLQGSHVSKHPV